MPAYFSISFELNKSQTAVKEFCAAVIDAGLVFKSGYWGFENDSFDDIVAWNQNKLDNNFQLGYTEHYSHDFKQMLFDFSDFSEVRLFVMNDKKSSTFDFNLIIPEDDFVEWTKNNDEYIPHPDVSGLRIRFMINPDFDPNANITSESEFDSHEATESEQPK